MGESLKTRAFRIAMNAYPMFFGTGGRILSIEGDWSRAVIRLKLNLWTRNYVGTIFGGSMFAAADPFFMVLLINTLGKEFVVWDKAGHIEFKKPGRGTLKAEFMYSPQEVEEIRSIARSAGSHEFVKRTEWIDAEGEVVSALEKTLYVATREHFEKRQDERRDADKKARGAAASGPG